jgi:drug/metabolite transporter (DMT)-like permease
MKNTESTPAKLKLGIAITIIACLFFAIASSMVYNFRGRFPTIQIIFIQNIVSLICILPLALRKGFKRLKTNELPMHFMRDTMGVGSYFLYFLAIRSLNLVDATTLNYTTPFFIPLIWLIWQKEKIQAAVWWSIIIGFIGVAIILNPSKNIFELGFLYGIFSGILSAIAITALRLLNVKKEPMSRTLFYYFSLGTILSFPFAWAVWVQPIEKEWLLAIGIGGATAIGQILLTIAYRYGTASFLSPLAYITVIYNALILYFAFDQELGWRSLVGSALIIIGGTMTYIFKKQPATVLETFEHPDQKTKPPL